jgi:pimeloyl-ACP methyl ester carboxylesterase
MRRRTVAVVPGVGVRRYLLPTMGPLRDRGVDVVLLPAPGQPGMASDLVRYADQIGPALSRAPLDLLVGLSIGTQAAADVAGRYRPPGRLVLVGPTVDPACRSLPSLLATWVRAGTREPAGLLGPQAADWQDAGARSLVAVLRSAIARPLDPGCAPPSVPTTVVRAERDLVTPHGYASALASAWDAQLVTVPGGAHSWPYDDPERFADLIEGQIDG